MGRLWQGTLREAENRARVRLARLVVAKLALVVVAVVGKEKPSLAEENMCIGKKFASGFSNGGFFQGMRAVTTGCPLPSGHAAGTQRPRRAGGVSNLFAFDNDLDHHHEGNDNR